MGYMSVPVLISIVGAIVCVVAAVWAADIGKSHESLFKLAWSVTFLILAVIFLWVKTECPGATREAGCVIGKNTEMINHG